MSYETQNLRNVLNHYGPRSIQDGTPSGGEVHNSGATKEAVVYIKGDDFVAGSFLSRAVLPAGAIVRNVVAEVVEPFVLGGTTPTINVGTDASETTNYGVELAEADAEAAGTYDGTPAGTWAAPLAADAAISVALGGTTPTVTDAGKAKVVIYYSKV